MPLFFTKQVKAIAHSGAVAAGTSTITPTNGVNMSGFDSVTFVVHWAAITASGVQSIEVHQSSDDGSSDAYTAITGTKVSVADDDDNKLTLVEVHCPREQYVKCIVNRATANSAINGIAAYLYNGAAAPVTEDSTVSGSEEHYSPAEGTA